MRHLAAFLIRLYQWTVSPLLGATLPLLPELLAVRATRRCCALACCAAAGSRSSASAAAIRGTPAASTRCHRTRRPICAPITLMNNTLFPSSPRLYLWATLGLLVFLNYQAWMKDYGPAPQSAAEPAGRGRTGAAGDGPEQPAARRSAKRRRPEHRGTGDAVAGTGARCCDAGRRGRTCDQRAHRRARCGHQPARRHAHARGPARLSAGEGRGSTPCAWRITTHRRLCTSCRPGSPARAPGRTRPATRSTRARSCRLSAGQRPRSCACR